MEKIDLNNLKLGFSDLEDQGISQMDNISSGEIGKEKIEALKESIAEIQEMIEGREALSGQVVLEGEKIKKEIDMYIRENEMTPLADKRDLMREKNDLRHKKVEISELQLNEKVGCWKDIALLKKELRLYERELSEREARMKMFNDILEEEN